MTHGRKGQRGSFFVRYFSLLFYFSMCVVAPISDAHFYLSNSTLFNLVHNNIFVGNITIRHGTGRVYHTTLGLSRYCTTIFSRQFGRDTIQLSTPNTQATQRGRVRLHTRAVNLVTGYTRVKQFTFFHPPVHRRVTHMTPFTTRGQYTGIVVRVTMGAISFIMENRCILQLYFFCTGFGTLWMGLPRYTLKGS